MVSDLLELVAQAIRDNAEATVEYDCAVMADDQTWAARGFLQDMEEAGYRLVPIAPTEVQSRAGLDVIAAGSYDECEIYAAMVDAALHVEPRPAVGVYYDAHVRAHYQKATDDMLKGWLQEAENRKSVIELMQKWEADKKKGA